MVYFVYNVLILKIWFLLKLSSLFSKTIRLEISKRNHSLKNLYKKVPKEHPVIWFHSASVGELDQAKALAQTIRRHRKNVFIIQSVFSSSVKESAFFDPLADAYFYLPFDLPFSYNKIFHLFRPKFLFIMAWDTWPNLLKKANQFGTKTYLCCASLSQQSSRKNPFVKLLTKSSFRYLSGIYPSHELMAKEFEGLVAEGTDFRVLGDTRFESVLNKLETGSPNPLFTEFVKRESDTIQKIKPIILGSTYPVCESYFLSYLANANDQNKYWIFPHKWEPKRMAEFQMKLIPYGTVGVFSEMKANAPLPQFLLFDLLGILAFAYQYGSFAYVGGAFHHRIHNTIEPAALGLALVTGPKVQNAPEALVMQGLGGLFRTTNETEFITRFGELVQNQDQREKMGNTNRNFVVENRGASEKIYNRVFPYDKI
ncbi:3-deoxy-D-manno-octulosonic acid transferase [Leptospira jelokensis]|uniref:3-deoxy-D-manno-octulosonic acid transferase n=1 Tax=Leptospira jelokensis TaxID=2484931 RepID=A0A4Z1A286_9LEPT|nr:glycosyltransferase N-terminal domain-containing protein [Leptospira jelokensis]TGL72311.1 3-deoxy-D-manno-octulosonic acid transferase [Leptospira jelokensis]